MGDNNVKNILDKSIKNQEYRTRSNSVGASDRSIREFYTPVATKKRTNKDRSPEEVEGNANKKHTKQGGLKGKGKEEEGNLSETEYLSLGMESLMKEIQNLTRKFEEESKERKECFNKGMSWKKGRKKEMLNKTELKKG
ncbi:hypothetical protein QAD02_021706 [Eretmocerus hayati]|uniref:Uncharacterized protein n=1 Tax=Eretmocerus hayati TaxID=131215 RepID=A0ACC2PR07_9HYME|nr:hypothetical protein QAD02_021706 [Eretmocerus hayati]